MALPPEQDRLLRRLFQSQRLAVLATRDNEQAYASLVAFAETLDLKRLLFVTSRDTRKYRNMQLHPQAALLIDNRPLEDTGFERSVAVTAVGDIQEVPEGADPLLQCYLAKHPYLEPFVAMQNNVLLSLHVRHYVVSTFQQVSSFSIAD